jgi:hypothetical protein
MNTTFTDVLKAGIAILIGWAAAGWMLVTLTSLTALVA